MEKAILYMLLLGQYDSLKLLFPWALEADELSRTYNINSTSSSSTKKEKNISNTRKNITIKENITFTTSNNTIKENITTIKRNITSRAGCRMHIDNALRKINFILARRWDYDWGGIVDLTAASPVVPEIVNYSIELRSIEENTNSEFIDDYALHSSGASSRSTGGLYNPTSGGTTTSASSGGARGKEAHSSSSEKKERSRTTRTSRKKKGWRNSQKWPQMKFSDELFLSLNATATRIEQEQRQNNYQTKSSTEEVVVDAFSDLYWWETTQAPVSFIEDQTSATIPKASTSAMGTQENFRQFHPIFSPPPRG
ncbi:unnamed protein product, partial [Amoebophrya sp. A25]|eukprot:GSA25T00026459001.1